MKLGQAKKAAMEHLDTLYWKKKDLSEKLKETQSSGVNFDRVELSKELSAIESEYEQTKGVMEKLSLMDANIQNAEAARQQSEAIAEYAETMMKILELFRRIAKGDQVPPADEKKLMEYDPKMQMLAKNMALMNQNAEKEKHDSLWEDEGTEEERMEPAEVAANTEVGNPMAEATTSSDSVGQSDGTSSSAAST